MNILDLLPKSEVTKATMCLCDVCKEKFFPKEGEIIICPIDRELMFVCEGCLKSPRYPSYLYLKGQGEI